MFFKNNAIKNNRNNFIILGYASKEIALEIAISQQLSILN